MGLDQFLYANSFIVCKDANDMEDEYEQYQAKRGIAIKWRKANQIHNWFVTNVQGGHDDCGIYEVSVSDLVKLHDTCKKVLDSTEFDGKTLDDPSTAWELLPTKEGFFFGSTDYDQWYWWDLQYTVDRLGRILDNLVPSETDKFCTVHIGEPDWEVHFYYTSSW